MVGTFNSSSHTPQTHRCGPRQQGQGLVEYALILVLVAVVSILILSATGTAISDQFCDITNTFRADVTCGDNDTVITLLSTVQTNPSKWDVTVKVEGTGFDLATDPVTVTYNAKSITLTPDTASGTLSGNINVQGTDCNASACPITIEANGKSVTASIPG